MLTLSRCGDWKNCKKTRDPTTKKLLGGLHPNPVHLLRETAKGHKKSTILPGVLLESRKGWEDTIEN
jgi:hypothetical protein